MTGGIWKDFVGQVLPEGTGLCFRIERKSFEKGAGYHDFKEILLYEIVVETVVFVSVPCYVPETRESGPSV